MTTTELLPSVEDRAIFFQKNAISQPITAFSDLGIDNADLPEKVGEMKDLVDERERLRKEDRDAFAAVREKP